MRRALFGLLLPWAAACGGPSSSGAGAATLHPSPTAPPGTPEPSPTAPPFLEFVRITDPQWVLFPLPSYAVPNVELADFGTPVHPELYAPCVRIEAFEAVNASAQPLGINAISTSGEGFSIPAGWDYCGGTNLPVGGSCVFWSCFGASSPGVYRGELVADTGLGIARYAVSGSALSWVRGLDPGFGARGAIFPDAYLAGIEPSASRGWGAGAGALIGHDLTFPSRMQMGPWEPFAIGAFTHITSRGASSSQAIWKSQLPDFGPGPWAMFVAASLSGDSFYAQLSDSPYDHWLLTRFRLDGSWDSTFPLRDLTYYPDGSRFEYGARTLDVTSAGLPSSPGERVLAGMGNHLYAFQVDGAAVAAFGTDGYTPAPAWGNTFIPLHQVDGEGRLTVSTWSGLQRYTAAGVLDTGFSWSGSPTALARDRDGTLLVATTGGSVSRLDAAGTATPLLQVSGTVLSLAVDGKGNRLLATTAAPGILRFPPDGSAPETVGLEGVDEVLCDPTGGCYGIGFDFTHIGFAERIPP